MISLSKTGPVMVLMIQMFCGLTGNRNFSILFIFMHHSIRTRHARTNKAPWINSQLKKGMRDRDAAKRKAITSNDPRDWEKYKKLQNILNNNNIFQSHYVISLINL